MARTLRECDKLRRINKRLQAKRMEEAAMHRLKWRQAVRRRCQKDNKKSSAVKAAQVPPPRPPRFHIFHLLRRAAQQMQQRADAEKTHRSSVSDGSFCVFSKKPSRPDRSRLKRVHFAPTGILKGQAIQAVHVLLKHDVLNAGDAHIFQKVRGLLTTDEKKKDA